jgi:uncharacterized protein (TIGR03435 family)
VDDKNPSCATTLFFATALIATALNACAQSAGAQQTQSATPGTPVTRAAKDPDWQTSAGGKMEFDVVSIRPIKPDEFMPPTFDMTAGKNWSPNVGIFKADFPVLIYIAFAYKLFPTSAETESLLLNQPLWVSQEGMAIRMRASGNPTKDQARLMMQSMLADRFKLAIHFETREVPVLALTLIRPGKLGPTLRSHAQGPTCDVPATSQTKAPAIGPDLTPSWCGMWQSVDKPNHMELDGARDVSMSQIAAFLSLQGALDRPMVDQTGLTGTYDFSIQWTKDTGASDADAATDSHVTTFLEALKEQLGMKLVRTTAPLSVPVIDHIERPSEN